MPQSPQETGGFEARPGTWVRSWLRVWGIPVVLLAGVLVSGALFLGQRESSQIMATWRGRMEGGLQTQERALAAWTFERAGDARMVLTNPLTRVWAAGGRDQQMAAYLESVRNAYAYRAVRISSAGRVLMVGEVSAPVLSLLRQPQPPAGTMSWNVVELPGGDVRVIVRQSPLESPQLSVALVIDPTVSLFDFVRGATNGTRTGETSLVTQVGDTALIFTPDRGREPGQPLPRAPLTRDRMAAVAALAGTDTFGLFENHSRTEVFAVAGRDSATGWGIVRKVDVAEVMEPIFRMRAVLAALVLLILALAASLTVVATSRARRRDLRDDLTRQGHELDELRLRAQAVDAESRAGRLSRLLDDAGDEIYVVNSSTLMIELANRRAADSLGYDMASLCRRTLLDLAPLIDPAAFRARLEDLREGRLNEWVVETEHQRRDGTRYPVAIHTRYSTAEYPPVYVAMASDITTTRSLESMLRQAQKMEAVGRLAGGVAHDFNNILTVIQVSGSLALETMPAADPAREDVEQIIDAARRASALTAQLLAFSRRQIIKPEVESMNSLVESIQPMLERLLGEDVELVVRLSASPDLVLVGKGQIDQVIMNLAVNSRDAMPHGGRLTIETTVVSLTQEYSEAHLTTTEGPHVMLAVSDTGLGMDEETRARIFEPFFTTKGHGVGTGLGLSTVFGIVKQSTGNIWVYSEPGQGTVFKLYFPAAEAAARPIPIETLPLDDAERGHETILLVEDEAAIRRVAARVLTAAGYSVIQAGNGEEALAVAQSEEGPIHLLLTDVVMPRLGGRALAERLAIRRPRMRVLYMSGFTDNAIVHHNVLDYGLDFLQKPFTPARLIEGVKRALGRT